MFEVRTDLAVEENERITKAQEEAKGITVTEEDFEEINTGSRREQAEDEF